MLQAISECKQHEKEKEFGTVECCDRSGVLERGELERGWFGRGLYRHFPVPDVDAHRLGCVAVARMFQKIGWSQRWCTRNVHAVRTLGKIAMSGSYCQSEMERTVEDCRGCGKMDCGRAGWTDDHHFSTLPHKGRNLGEFEATLTELQEFLNGRPKQRVILGGDFNVNLFGLTDYLHVGESIPRPRTLIDTKDSLRARGLHTMLTELDLTETNTWMNADTDRGLFTRSSWSNPADSLTPMDFIMTSRKLEMKHVQVMDSDWFKTDHRAVYAVLSLRPKMRYTVKNAGNLRGWEPDDSWHDAAAATLTDWKSWNKLAPLLVETAKAQRKVESKEMSVTEMELKTLLLRKKKTGRYLERSELDWLCREIWRKKKALKREKHLDKIKESAEMGRAPKKTQSKHFNWKSISKDENPKSVLTKYFRDLYSISEEQEELTQSERRHWVELWKNMRMDCAGGMLFSPKKLENVLKKLKNGKGSPDQITADVLKALPPERLEKLARSLSLMCWNMDFPEDWLCSLTVMAPKVVCATCLTKFRPIAGLCAMRKVLGYVWLKSLLH